MELIPVKYCVTIEIRNSKLNLVIIKPPRLLSNLGGSLQDTLSARYPLGARGRDKFLASVLSANVERKPSGMKQSRGRWIFESISVVAILLLAVISLWPSRTSQQTVRVDHGRMIYTGGVLNHKFAGQGTLKVQGQGTYVGHFKNGRFTGSGEYIAPSGWRIKDDFGNGVLRGSVQLREGRRTYTDKILKDGQLEYAH